MSTNASSTNPGDAASFPGGPAQLGLLDNRAESPVVVTIYPRERTAEVTIPASAHTLAGFRDWALAADFPDRGRLSFLQGELVVDMSPEYFETHNFIKTEITSTIYQIVRESRLGRVFSDRSLISHEAAGLSTEPDAVFVSHESLAAGVCRIGRRQRASVAEELIGSPDWVLEIVSTSSRRKDCELLPKRYFAAGVKEYWLVDALADEIAFQILVRGDGQFVPVAPQGEWLTSSVFGRAFRLVREKGDDGLWQYDLESAAEGL